jgi:lipoprotein signal peptidase
VRLLVSFRGKFGCAGYLYREHWFNRVSLCLAPVLNTVEQLGYGFILGGALGNGIDRFFNSCVVDGQAFNLRRRFFGFSSDSFPRVQPRRCFINIGHYLLLIVSFRHQPPDRTLGAFKVPF